MHQATVEVVRLQAIDNFVSLEEAMEDPHADVTEGVMRALVNRYGAKSVRDVVKLLRI